MFEILRHRASVVKALWSGSGNQSQSTSQTYSSRHDVSWAQGHDAIVTVANLRYIAPYHDKDLSLGLRNGPCLVTVIVLSDHKIVTEEWLSDTISQYRSQDDVFTEPFLCGIIFQGAREEDIMIEARARDYLRSHGNEWLAFTLMQVLPGPYIQIDGRLRDAWKLEDDLHGTAMTTLRPQLCPSNVYKTLQILGADGKCKAFALRSRLKTGREFNSPIKGWRIVVKDNIDLNGVISTIGNRAFGELYPPRSTTAASIQKLINQGVVVLGKTKMSSFGNWEEPVEYIDYQAPWNPRADGYQSPGASSSGSAAAIAAYNWLDIAVGTDSDITRPALWCGCYGLRPSTGATSSQGMEPNVPAWDTPGILARDISKLRIFAKEWLDDDSLITESKSFSAIVWPIDFWNMIEPEQVQIARRFLKDIQMHLHIEAVEISFAHEWERQSPRIAKGQTLMQYISPAMAGPAYDGFHSQLYFHQDYAMNFGRQPYTSPRNEQSCDLGREITKAQRDDGFSKISIYADWINDTILSGKLSNALILFPQENMTPRYRDEVPTFQRPPQQGISSLAFAAVLKCPALAVPLAQLPYTSKVTGNEEYLPFAVTIASPPRTDILLLQVVEEILISCGRPTAVEPGKVMFKAK